MPVLFDSSAQGAALIAGGAATGSKTLTHNVSPAGRDTVVALVAVIFTSTINTTFATFSATFGGQAMTEVGSGKTWDTLAGCLHLFKLEDAPRGSQSVVASFIGAPTELATRNFMVVSLTYSGVDAVTALTDAGSSSTTSNTVSVASVRPAHRVASFHGVGKSKKFSGYNQTKRNEVQMLGGGSLLAGDAPGDATVTCTATQPSTNEWGAIGVALTPSVVEIAAALRIPHTVTAAMRTFREAIPHPDREWTVPPPEQGPVTMIAGNFARTPAGVLMPIWVKDTNDILEYTLHWDHYLADDDEITSVRHITSGSLRVFSETGSGSTTQVWLNGGTANITHPVVVRFGTKKGRQHDFTFYVAGIEN